MASRIKYCTQENDDDQYNSFKHEVTEWDLTFEQSPTFDKIKVGDVVQTLCQMNHKETSNNKQKVVKGTETWQFWWGIIVSKGSKLPKPKAEPEVRYEAERRSPRSGAKETSEKMNELLNPSKKQKTKKPSVPVDAVMMVWANYSDNYSIEAWDDISDRRYLKVVTFESMKQTDLQDIKQKLQSIQKLDIFEQDNVWTLPVPRSTYIFKTTMNPFEQIAQVTNECLNGLNIQNFRDPNKCDSCPSFVIRSDNARELNNEPNKDADRFQNINDVRLPEHVLLQLQDVHQLSRNALAVADTFHDVLTQRCDIIKHSRCQKRYLTTEQQNQNASIEQLTLFNCFENKYMNDYIISDNCKQYDSLSSRFKTLPLSNYMQNMFTLKMTNNNNINEWFKTPLNTSHFFNNTEENKAHASISILNNDPKFVTEYKLSLDNFKKYFSKNKNNRFVVDAMGVKKNVFAEIDNGKTNGCMTNATVWDSNAPKKWLEEHRLNLSEHLKVYGVRKDMSDMVSIFNDGVVLGKHTTPNDIHTLSMYQNIATLENVVLNKSDVNVIGAASLENPASFEFHFQLKTLNHTANICYLLYCTPSEDNIGYTLYGFDNPVKYEKFARLHEFLSQNQKYHTITGAVTYDPIKLFALKRSGDWGMVHSVQNLRYNPAYNGLNFYLFTQDRLCYSYAKLNKVPAVYYMCKSEKVCVYDPNLNETFWNTVKFKPTRPFWDYNSSRARVSNEEEDEEHELEEHPLVDQIAQTSNTPVESPRSPSPLPPTLIRSAEDLQNNSPQKKPRHEDQRLAMDVDLVEPEQIDVEEEDEPAQSGPADRIEAFRKSIMDKFKDKGPLMSYERLQLVSADNNPQNIAIQLRYNMIAKQVNKTLVKLRQVRVKYATLYQMRQLLNLDKPSKIVSLTDQNTQTIITIQNVLMECQVFSPQLDIEGKQTVQLLAWLFTAEKDKLPDNLKFIDLFKFRNDALNISFGSDNVTLQILGGMERLKVLCNMKINPQHITPRLRLVDSVCDIIESQNNRLYNQTITICNTLDFFNSCLLPQTKDEAIITISNRYEIYLAFSEDSLNYINTILDSNDGPPDNIIEKELYELKFGNNMIGGAYSSSLIEYEQSDYNQSYFQRDHFKAIELAMGIAMEKDMNPMIKTLYNDNQQYEQRAIYDAMIYFLALVLYERGEFEPKKQIDINDLATTLIACCKNISRHDLSSIYSFLHEQVSTHTSFTTDETDLFPSNLPTLTKDLPVPDDIHYLLSMHWYIVGSVDYQTYNNMLTSIVTTIGLVLEQQDQTPNQKLMEPKYSEIAELRSVQPVSKAVEVSFGGGGMIKHSFLQSSSRRWNSFKHYHRALQRLQVALWQRTLKRKLRNRRHDRGISFKCERFF